MDLQSRKLKLIEWILSLGDSPVLKHLEKLSRADHTWWENLSAEERASIERGIAEANAGKVKSHSEVMSKYKNGFENRTD